MDRLLASATEMIAFGEHIAPCLRPGWVVFLQGDLGAGKTTLSQGILLGLGYEGIVNSPTFSLLESYDLPIAQVHHFDLYRLQTADELEMIGARELFNPHSICLIEWPNKAADYLPSANLVLSIQHHAHKRNIQVSGPALSTMKKCLKQTDDFG